MLSGIYIAIFSAFTFVSSALAFLVGRCARRLPFLDDRIPWTMRRGQLPLPSDREGSAWSHDRVPDGPPARDHDLPWNLKLSPPFFATLSNDRNCSGEQLSIPPSGFSESRIATYSGPEAISIHSPFVFDSVRPVPTEAKTLPALSRFGLETSSGGSRMSVALSDTRGANLGNKPDHRTRINPVVQIRFPARYGTTPCLWKQRGEMWRAYRDLHCRLPILHARIMCGRFSGWT
jgi:hypothetical protein